MFGLELVAKLVKILASEESPNQIAMGFAMGMIIGFTPFWAVHNLLLILLIIVLRVNIASAMLGYVVFGLLAYPLDGLFHAFGFYLLVDAAWLHGFWQSVNQIPIFALSRYNNTVMVGSLVSGLILFVPVFFLFKAFVGYYRRKLHPKFQKLKIVQLFKASKFYAIYQKVKFVGE
ncbi:MAG TPA: TIGR03546 family protein [Caldithrix abyssi]|uniref:TIGR03546 family protein n=1 Tax=Caldithrix abyssi TaxID=187145 RepID=A0A7V5UE60_CALAY|nr:TIGR03546 family protein [Caldithrix abyssi]